MAQTQAKEPDELLPDPAPGAEGTEYEGMAEEDIERAEFEKSVEEDPEIDEGAAPEPAPVLEDPEPDPDPEKDPEPAPVSLEADPPADPPAPPTGLEWMDEIPEEQREAAKYFIGRQGQTIARLDQRVSSHLGQLQPAQRTIAQMQGQIRDLKGKLGEQQPSTIKLDDRQKDFDAWIDGEYKEFPEEAAKLKARFSESLDGISKVLENAAPAPQPETLASGPDQREETQHLATAYSDWGERRFSPEFSQWIEAQAPETTALLNSPYAADNVALLDAFTRANPQWTPPQTPEQFHSLAQAQHSPLYRGWAQGEGINPDMNLASIPDFQRDMVLSRFKEDLGVVRSEQLEPDDPPKVSKLAARRSEQLQNRDPGSRRTAVKPGQKVDLSTKEGQRAYYDQLIAADPDLK